MSVAARRQTVGFDRKIRLEWLDATAEWAAQGLGVAEVRSKLEQLLEGQVAGGGHRSAREKTVTVLLHVWVAVPRTLAPLRDDGLLLMRNRSSRDRLVLHWGMCVSTYPFFRDVAATTGRLLRLQGKATLSQITRRTAEAWGDRSTVARAMQRVVRSLVEWGVLKEAEERGVFVADPAIEMAAGDRALPWLAEAAVSSGQTRARPLNSLLMGPTFFPFRVHLSARALAGHPRLEVHRQGLDVELVVGRSRASGRA